MINAIMTTVRMAQTTTAANRLARLSLLSEEFELPLNSVVGLGSGIEAMSGGNWSMSVIAPIAIASEGTSCAE